MTRKEIADNIRSRLGIENLNAMQRAMERQSSKHIVLLAPTGSGKTVGFALQLLRATGRPDGRVQAVVIAPSRELVIQTAEVLRRIAAGVLKVSALYGGHSVEEEKATLSVAPDIVVATPGRLLDHMRRGRVDVSAVRALVLDEYDKSLELGFQDDMRSIVRRMRSLSLVVLTSATQLSELPDFVDLGGAATVDFRGTDEGAGGTVSLRRVLSPSPDKLETLEALLRAMGGERTIVFVNYRDAAERVFGAMKRAGLPVGLYHGGLDQIDRDKAIVRFNNGTTPLLVSTDLGSRGLDIDNVQAVVHYHMPSTAEVWTHRNGRTGRMGASGEVFVIESAKEDVPEFVSTPDGDFDPAAAVPAESREAVATLFFDAGKKDKISRGDIVGFLCQQGGIDAQQIGKIDLRDRCAYVAVPRAVAARLLADLGGKKIKGRKVRISEAR
ncbi:MAG: DEAD/DEAH box helicase [Muribaculaceae bacterium]|nr:DEAD/DEAH box helicase [Muribaculaceae bacterium]